MALMEEVVKSINSIKFSLLSPNEIRKLSVVEIKTPDTYDEDGVPITSGLMDGRLGTLEPRQKCKTCGHTAANCPGHFGHIELVEPVIHVSFAKIIYKLLTSTCRNCGRVLLSQDKVDRLKIEIQKEIELMNSVSQETYDKIFKSMKNIRSCPHCGEPQYPIEFSKPTTFYELIDGGAVRLMPSVIRERLERIPDEDLLLFGIDPKTARPEWAIL
ncbi:MAG: DNA-directed RNA polymerase subunit A'/A'', partial [Candidatus Bathyarchaeia archaeon]